MIRKAISQLLEGRSLTAEQAEGVMDQIMTGEATSAQIAGFLIALRVKGETVDEITGCARAMRRAAVRVAPRQDEAPGQPVLIDTCGTGGDGSGTFNISTATAFVAAAAGVPVVKHGNRAVSSQSGSADVLTALGVKIDGDAAHACRSLAETGLAFCFAPQFHPAVKNLAETWRPFCLLSPYSYLLTSDFCILYSVFPPR